MLLCTVAFTAADCCAAQAAQDDQESELLSVINEEAAVNDWLKSYSEVRLNLLVCVKK